MRQYGEVPPWNAAANTPAVKSVSGLGSKGAAGVQTPDSGGFGEIFAYADGTGIATSGSIAIVFPNTPPTLFIAGDAEFGTLSQATVSKTVTISWAGATIKARSTPYKIHYEWETSE